jgi:hypothetical protein
MTSHPSARHLRDLPPRRIDLFTKSTVLFGGFFQLFGWIFFTIGSILSWIFIPASEVVYWFEFGKEWKETQGVVLTVEATNSAVNDQLVYRNFYAFELDGQRYTGKSFTRGQQYQGGENAPIRYNAKNPGESYMAGSSRATFPAFVLFVLIFPLIGLGFIVSSLIKNWKALRLLEIGDFTRGKLLEKTATNGSVGINGQHYPIYKYQFEFENGGRKYAAYCKTHQAWLVEDEEREIILFDRFNPDFNVVYDATPTMPGISPEGMLERAPIGKALNLLLPLLAIGLNLLFFLWQPSLMR